MIKACYLFMFLTACCCTAAQNVHPGGVKNAARWFITRSPNTGQPAFTSVSDSGLLLPANSDGLKNTSLNGYPAVQFTGKGYFHLDVGQLPDNISIFTVYQAADTTHEAAIWQLDQGDKTRFVLTTGRAAGFDPVTYMNFTDLHRAQPRVSSYVHRTDLLTNVPGNTWWKLGDRPTNPRLPVECFNGMIPEWIAYDRVLNTRERMQVASYLAIKYGITLTGTEARYTNSQGRTVWKGTDYPLYHHNVAGIARDDSSGLLQLRSSSSNQQQLFTVSADRLPANNSYLLWGDDDRPLTSLPAMEGRPRLIQRKWLLVPNFPGTIQGRIDIDTRQFDLPADPQQVFWLLADRSGTGKFDPAQTELIPGAVSSNGLAQFKITLASGQPTVLAIAAGQELCLLTAIHPAPCYTFRQNSITVRAGGGLAPYMLTVTNQGTSTQHTISDAGTAFQISGLNAGFCRLTLRDARNKIFSDSFYINPAGAPSIACIDPTGYTIPAAGTLVLNAAQNMAAGLEYSWTGPGNFKVTGNTASVTEAGRYLLTVTDQGCAASRDFIVSRHPEGSFSRIAVYPNPSTGDFSVAVTLPQSASLRLSIYSADGRLLEQEDQQGRSNYLFTKNISAAGNYLIQCSPLGKTSTRQLVIVK